MKYKATIQAGNGYVNHTVEVDGVVTQADARRALEARYPGARIAAIRPS